MERRINWEIMAGPTHSVKDTNELFAVNELVSYRPTILMSSHAHCRTGLTRCHPNVVTIQADRRHFCLGGERCYPVTINQEAADQGQKEDVRRWFFFFWRVKGQFAFELLAAKGNISLVTAD